jgi:hypothetical protein
MNDSTTQIFLKALKRLCILLRLRFVRFGQTKISAKLGRMVHSNVRSEFSSSKDMIMTTVSGKVGNLVRNRRCCGDVHQKNRERISGRAMVPMVTDISFIRNDHVS